MSMQGGDIQIAIVGSGPSGFYAAEALLRSDLPITVDLYERLPTPYGLVRSGVAPDHQKLKQSIKVFERIVRHPQLNYLGHVEVGRDVSVGELRNAYHAVIFANGAQQDRRMGIPGEDLKGSHTATEFVGWYNGHPDFRNRVFDLTQEHVAIVGQGNVAADVCRILTRSVDELRTSDIAEHALDALAESRVREIFIIGRRGPAQAKFTTKELRELTALPGAVATVDSSQLELSENCQAELASHLSATAQKNMEVFRGIAANASSQAGRRIHFRFFASPVAIRGDDAVQGLRVCHNRMSGEPFAQVAEPNGAQEDLPCGLVFRSIGYKGSAIPELPFDEHKGIVPNRDGRVVGDEGPLPGLYVTGWIKRGANGIIGTNRADSLQTVESLLQDLGSLRSKTAHGRSSIQPLLAARGKAIVGMDEWFGIDAAEVARGAPKGKPREKFTTIEEMLAVVR